MIEDIGGTAHPAEITATPIDPESSGPYSVNIKFKSQMQRDAEIRKYYGELYEHQILMLSSLQIRFYLKKSKITVKMIKSASQSRISLIFGKKLP